MPPFPLPSIAEALSSASEHSRAGRLDQAEKFYRWVLRDHPDHAGALHGLATALLSLNRFVESEAAARKAVQATPNSAECWQTLGEAIGNQQRAGEAIECFRKAIFIKPDWPVAHYTLGLTLGRAGRLDEAIDSLRMALRLRPEFAEALSHLGKMLLAQRKLEEAIAALQKAVQLRPGHMDDCLALAYALVLARRNDEAVQTLNEALKLAPDNQELRLADIQFGLAALSGNDTPPAMPPVLVREIYNRRAETYERHMVEDLDYRVPRLLRDALAEVGAGENLDVLDLGCGTGLCGEVLRPLAGTLAGVDLSSAMIEKARERGVYDRLEVGEIVATLRGAPAGYDVLVAGGVSVYMGDLSDLLASAFGALRPGGVFAFSTESIEGSGWVLRPNRQYGHSADYIRETAAQCGFDIAGLATVTLQKEESGKDVRGLVVVLKKPGTGKE